MLFWRIWISAALVAVFAASATAEPLLPTDWHGTREGRLTVYGPGEKVFTRPMELRIAPREDGRAFTWRMVTEMNGQKRVRNYELVPVPGKPGEFQIDEKNGILLNARLAGNTLYTYYKDGDILINSRFELRGDSLFVELASVETKNPLTSEIKEDNIQIQSYRVGSVQVGELRRKR